MGELKVNSINLDRIANLIKAGVPTLRQIRDTLHHEVSYNQIKVVLAGMIRGEIDFVSSSVFENIAND